MGQVMGARESEVKASEVEAPAKSGPVVSPVPARPAEQRKLDAQQRQNLSARLKPLRKRLEQAELHIATLQQEKTAIEARLSQPLAAAEIADGGRRLKSVLDEIAKLEEAWLDLSEQIDALAT